MFLQGLYRKFGKVVCKVEQLLVVKHEKTFLPRPYLSNPAV